MVTCSKFRIDKILISALPIIVLIGCASTLTEKSANEIEKKDLKYLLKSLYGQPDRPPSHELREKLNCYESDPSIELRIVNIGLVDSEQNKPSELLYDLDGRKYLVHKDSLISGDDIDQICIEKIKPLIGKGHIISIDFSSKTESWDSLYIKSQKKEEKHLALIKNGKIIVSYKTHSSGIDLTRGFRITRPDQNNIADHIIKGLKETGKKDILQAENDYLLWLEIKIEKEPDNNELLDKIITLFFELRIQDCERIYDSYKKAAFLGMAGFPILYEMRSCLTYTEKSNEAITVYREILSKHLELPTDPENDWYRPVIEAYIRCFLGDAYYMGGAPDRAIDEFKKAQKLIKMVELRLDWAENKATIEKYRSKLEKEKAEDIKIIDTMIDLVSKG